MLESFLNKATGPKTCILIKKETLTQVFSCENCTIFKNNFFMKHSLIIFFRNFYVMIDIRPRSRKNFTIDRSKFLMKTCFFSTKILILLHGLSLLFNHFVFTEICEELKLQRETSGSN